MWVCLIEYVWFILMLCVAAALCLGVISSGEIIISIILCGSERVCVCAYLCVCVCVFVCVMFVNAGVAAALCLGVVSPGKY